MKTITLTIPSSLNNRKIQAVLEHHMGFSSSLIKALKTITGAVTLNGTNARLVDAVKCGDSLVITVPSDKSRIIPSSIPLDILYEDEDILIVNKPRSMPSHPSRSHTTDTLANAVAGYFSHSDCSFHVITRLDKDTSGAVLIAKNRLAAHTLTNDIQSGTIQKEYIAVVNGTPNPASGTIDAPIGRKEPQKPLRHVTYDGKTAVTEYELIKSDGTLSLVALHPVTGRTHQLRVHLAYIGTPIYGDCLYGAAQVNTKTLLHCGKLSFTHPVTKSPFTISAPIPDDIKALTQ